jgi:hypothetical protein
MQGMQGKKAMVNNPLDRGGDLTPRWLCKQAVLRWAGPVSLNVCAPIPVRQCMQHQHAKINVLLGSKLVHQQ